MPFKVGDRVELVNSLFAIPAGCPGIIIEIKYSIHTDDGLSPLFPYTVDFLGEPDGRDWPIRRGEIKLATYDPEC